MHAVVYFDNMRSEQQKKWLLGCGCLCANKTNRKNSLRVSHLFAVVSYVRGRHQRRWTTTLFACESDGSTFGGIYRISSLMYVYLIIWVHRLVRAAGKEDMMHRLRNVILACSWFPFIIYEWRWIRTFSASCTTFLITRICQNSLEFSLIVREAKPKIHS